MAKKIFIQENHFTWQLIVDLQIRSENLRHSSQKGKKIEYANINSKILHGQMQAKTTFFPAIFGVNEVEEEEERKGLWRMKNEREQENKNALMCQESTEKNSRVPHVIDKPTKTVKSRTCTLLYISNNNNNNK